MQSSEFWDLAVWRMRWDREVGVVERELKNVSQVEFGVVAQTGARICTRLLALCNSEFPAVETVRLLAGPIRYAHENHAFVVFLGRNNEAGSGFGLGLMLSGKWNQTISPAMGSGHQRIRRFPIQTDCCEQCRLWPWGLIF